MLNHKNSQFCAHTKIHNFFSMSVEMYIYFGLWKRIVIKILMIITTVYWVPLLGLYLILTLLNNPESRYYFHFMDDLCWEAPPRISPWYSEQFAVPEQQLQLILKDEAIVTIYWTFTLSLHCSRSFTFIVSLHSHNNPTRYIIMYRCSNRGSERLSNVP